MFFGTSAFRYAPAAGTTINKDGMIRWRRFLRRKQKLYLTFSILSLLNIVYPHQASAQVTKKLEAGMTGSVSVIIATAVPQPAPRLPDVPGKPAKRTVVVVATAYTSTVAETDSDPFTTASGAKVADGVIAMNGMPFGTKVRLPDHYGDKVFTVLDRMGRGGKNRIDIWMQSRHQAFDWGVRKVRIEIL